MATYSRHEEILACVSRYRRKDEALETRIHMGKSSSTDDLRSKGYPTCYMGDVKRLMRRRRYGFPSKMKLAVAVVAILCIGPPTIFVDASWVDPDTPEKARTTIPLNPDDTREYELVRQAGRPRADGLVHPNCPSFAVSHIL